MPEAAQVMQQEAGKSTPPPETPRSFWQRLRDQWTTVLVLIAALGIGWRISATLATKTELDVKLEKHALGEGSIRAQVTTLQVELVALKVEISALRADIAATKEAATATRKDIKDLTEYLLEHPPKGRSP